MVSEREPIYGAYAAEVAVSAKVTVEYLFCAMSPSLAAVGGRIQPGVQRDERLLSRERASVVGSRIELA